MPELAEIELNIKQLKVLKNFTCTEIKLLDGKVSNILKDEAKKINKQLPADVKNVGSRGKFMWIEFTEGKDEHKELITHIGFHLGLVGKLTVSINYNPQKYNCIVFTFICKNKTKNRRYFLTFNDYRNFGNVYFMTREKYVQHLNKIGTPLNKLKKWQQFRDIMKETKKGNNMPIAKVLLLQDIISGIGNYMRNEALYTANINPHKLKSKMTDADWKGLYKSLIKVYKWALESQLKEIDYHKTKFKVYKQKKDPRGNEVTMEKLAGRSIYWVPKVQK